jgi:transposase
MKKPRRKFSSEFKEKTAKLVLEQGMTRTKVAQDLGVSINQVSKWVGEFQSKGSEAFPGNGRLSAQDQRIKDLESEVRQLRMERDILKKATAFFANHGR